MTPIASESSATRTTCPYCGVGCGVLATPDGEGGAAIAGDGEHPSNFGRLCSKGSALGETIALQGRLLHPMIRCKGALERVAWSDALDHVAHRLKHIMARDGADAVAFYLSGQLLTEDYYVANKLMKGFVGTANIDTNSRLCMSSAVAAHKQAFGADLVPAVYEDLEEAELLVFSGHNAAWTHPVLFRRIEALRVELAAVSARLEAGTLQDADRMRLLEQSEARLRMAFDSLATETLRNNSEMFLQLAREAMGRAHLGGDRRGDILGPAIILGDHGFEQRDAVADRPGRRTGRR